MTAGVRAVQGVGNESAVERGARYRGHARSESERPGDPEVAVTVSKVHAY